MVFAWPDDGGTSLLNEVLSLNAQESRRGRWTGRRGRITSEFLRTFGFVLR